jgi:hypothetical protein
MSENKASSDDKQKQPAATPAPHRPKRIDYKFVFTPTHSDWAGYLRRKIEGVVWEADDQDAEDGRW